MNNRLPPISPRSPPGASDRGPSLFSADDHGPGRLPAPAFPGRQGVPGSQIAVQKYNALSGSVNLSLTVFDSLAIPGYKSAKAEAEAQRLASAEAKRQLAYEVSNAFIVTLGVGQVLKRRGIVMIIPSRRSTPPRRATKPVWSGSMTSPGLSSRWPPQRWASRNPGTGGYDLPQLGHLLVEQEMIQKKLKIPDSLIKAPKSRPLPAPAGRGSPEPAARFELAALERPGPRGPGAHPHPEMVPSLTLAGQYRYTNESGLTGRSTNWNVGATLNWALFDGFSRNGQHSEYKALARSLSWMSRPP